MRPFALIGLFAVASAAFAPQLASVTGSTPLRSHGNSTLYTLTVDGATSYVEPMCVGVFVGIVDTPTPLT